MCAACRVAGGRGEFSERLQWMVGVLSGGQRFQREQLQTQGAKHAQSDLGGGMVDLVPKIVNELQTFLAVLGQGGSAKRTPGNCVKQRNWNTRDKNTTTTRTRTTVKGAYLHSIMQLIAI
jgi:hypothetical protein